MKRMLSTKILPDPLQARFVAAGWELTQYNAISVEFLPVPFRPEGSVVIFTSKHALRAYLLSNPDRGLTGVSCLCVGASTASMVREHGGEVLECAPTATELATVITKKYTDQSFVYYCSDRRLDIIPEALEKGLADWQEVTAYRTKTVDKAFNQSFEGILFFSPSGVEGFTKSNDIGVATAYCIGPTTAEEVKKHTKKYKIAASPDLPTLVALAIQTINPVKN